MLFPLWQPQVKLLLRVQVWLFDGYIPMYQYVRRIPLAVVNVHRVVDLCSLVTFPSYLDFALVISDLLYLVTLLTKQ